MDLQLALEQRAKVEEFQRKHRIGLLTLLFTDMVGSTRLKQELGDREAVALIQRHHAVVREVLEGFKEGEEIGTAGDSFFIVFTKPSEAAQFSLALQHRLRNEAQQSSRPLLDRVGIHIGEVVVEERPGSAKPKDLYGLQVDICARVMSLAEGDQILLTRSAFDNARQVLKGQEIEGLNKLNGLQWLNHGPYVLKGVEEPLEICEVGEIGLAVLTPPPDSEKVHRYVSPDSEPVLGWRPALDQVVPGTEWVLEEKLGEGGFGEVWVGLHRTLKERRVFKFCFRADRVRALKREVTLFRLLKERIGEHSNIVRLHEVFFNEPPFYIEMEYVEGRDLKTWSERHGGVGTIPLEMRLEIVAQVADALQAAHDAGVIHRDVKPSNILIAERGTRSAESANHKSEFINHKCEAKLTDFGIGQVVSQEALAGLTKLGFTQTMVSPGSSALTGTQLYMAPEVIAGKPASIRSDIFSLGVVLYQLLKGDFSNPVTIDWAGEITDRLLQADLQRCLAGNPQDRFTAAGQLADNLRLLPVRRERLTKQEAELAARERAAYRRGVIRTASLATVIVALVAGLALVAMNQSRKARATALRESQERERAQRLLYHSNMNLAQQAWEQNNLGRLRQLLEETQEFPDRGFEWYYWQRKTHLELRTLRGHLGGVRSVAFSPDGERFVTSSDDWTAKVWETSSGRELLTLRGHTNSLWSVAISADGQRIVTGSLDQAAKVWDSASGRELLTLRGHTNGISSAAFSPDGQRIVTGSMDQTAKVWDAASGRELLTLRGHSNSIWSVAVSPDGQRIVTGSGDKTAKVWDAATGRELLALKEPTNRFRTALFGEIRSVAFSQDGQRIVTFSDSGDGTWLWETITGRPVSTLLHPSGDSSVAFSPNGRWIVTGGSSQTATVRDVLTAGIRLTNFWVWDRGTSPSRPSYLPPPPIPISGRSRSLKGHSGPIWAVAFSADSQWIVTASEDGMAKLWDTEGGGESIGPFGTKRPSIPGPILCVAISPDGQWVAVAGSETDKVSIINAASGQEQLLTIEGHSAPVRSLAFSRDGQRVVAASEDGTVTVSETGSGGRPVSIKIARGPILSMALSPNGQWIAVGSSETTKVWELATRRELFTLTGHTSGIASVAFSADGQRIVTTSADQTAKVWDATGSRELLTLKGHSAGIISAAFSLDGQRIVTGSLDKTAKVWDGVSGTELLTLIGHKDEIRAVVFSPDGRRIVTGSADHTAKVWDTKHGRELLTFKEYAAISSVAFSANGQQIVTSSAYGTANVWEAATKEQVAAWQKEERAAEKRLAALKREQTK